MIPRANPLCHAVQRVGVLCVLLVAIVMGLAASCAHQPPDIDTYVQRLERPERDEYQQPDKVVEAMNIRPGMVVADIGAGSGYFTRRLAQAVGERGKILAIDVEQKMLVYNRHELEQLGLADRAKFIQAKPDDPSLPDHSVDLIFMCNTYHHLDHHVEYFAEIKNALTTNGRAVIVDFHHDERSGKLGFSKHHLVPKEQVIMHMQQAGFVLSNEHTFLPRQYFLEFERTTNAS